MELIYLLNKAFRSMIKMDNWLDIKQIMDLYKYKEIQITIAQIHLFLCHNFRKMVSPSIMYLASKDRPNIMDNFNNILKLDKLVQVFLANRVHIMEVVLILMDKHLSMVILSLHLLLKMVNKSFTKKVLMGQDFIMRKENL